MTENAITTTDTGVTNSITGFADGIAREVSESGYYATFDTSDMDGRRKLFNATQGAKLLREFMDTPLAITDIVFSPTTVSDDEGFSNTVMGVYLIDENGVAYASSSQGVCKSAATILAQLGTPADWGGPLMVVCQETYTAKGRRYKSLKLA